MTAIKPAPSAAQIKANLAALREQGAPDDVIDRYMASVGATPVTDAAPAPPPVATPPAPKVGLGETALLSGMQGATLGLNDEATGAIDAFSPTGLAKALMQRRNPLDTYRQTRDAVRERTHAGEKQNPKTAFASELAGGLVPSLAAGPGMGVVKAGALFGGASALGHGEGSAKEQAIGTAEGAAGGAALAGALSGAATIAGKTGIPQRLADLMPGGARRQAVRAAATVIEPVEAGAKVATRDALAPGQAVLGESSPDAAQLGKVLGRSPKAAITGPRSAWARVKEVTKARRLTGKEYDAFQQKLPIDQTISDLADRAGMPLDPAATDVDFSVIHRMRHEISKAARRASGMSKNDLLETRGDIDTWLQSQVPGLDKVDADYSTLSGHLSDALNSFKVQRKAAVQGAVREGGSNARGADRPLSFWHQVNQIMKPSPEKAGNAMEDLLFNPANTQQSLADIATQRTRVLAGQHPVEAPVAAMLGQGAGALAAPQLNPNAAMAHQQAAALRSQGASDAQLVQALGATFTPEVVRFIVASTPARIGQ